MKFATAPCSSESCAAGELHPAYALQRACFLAIISFTRSPSQPIAIAAALASCAPMPERMPCAPLYTPPATSPSQLKNPPSVRSRVMPRICASVSMSRVGSRFSRSVQFAGASDGFCESSPASSFASSLFSDFIMSGRYRSAFLRRSFASYSLRRFSLCHSPPRQSRTFASYPARSFSGTSSHITLPIQSLASRTSCGALAYSSFERRGTPRTSSPAAAATSPAASPMCESMPRLDSTSASFSSSDIRSHAWRSGSAAAPMPRLSVSFTLRRYSAPVLKPLPPFHSRPS